MKIDGLSKRRNWRRETRVVSITYLPQHINQTGGSPTVWAVHASESNLFFSSMYGASADIKFGLKPRNVSRF